jgi:hypothetical protein
MGFDQPWVDLLALPVALLGSLLLSQSWFGRLLLLPVQIQFHELGHAVVAWLSSRAALPLPFGFTFWSLERSLFTGSCVAFLLALFAWRAVHEQRRFGILLAACASLAFVGLSLLVSVERSHMLTLLGGQAGELVLTTLAIVGFYFRLPDKLRWDFFRFVVLGPAMGTWVSALALWLGVWRGTRALPMGSLLGSEGSGDLDRLIAEHGLTPAQLRTGYGELSLWTVGLVLLVYGSFATRAALRLAPGATSRRSARVAQRVAARLARR